MKKYIALFMAVMMVLSIMTGCAAQPDPNKKAMLVVSFGTSYADTRAITIDATVNAFKEKFADYDTYSAFTSQTIIDILKERDQIVVMNVKEAMDKLKTEKYGKVIIQPLHVMNGAEYDELQAIVEPYKADIKDIVIGKGLLSTHEDYVGVVEALKPQLPQLTANEAVVFMGHGTHHHANAVYGALEYAFHDAGYKNVFVGTVEGYPAFEDVVERLKENNITKVTLMPLMVVAGDHAQNDMGGDEKDSWKTMLKSQGYEVDVYLHGLGEVKGIQDIYLKHAEEAIKNEIIKVEAAE